jgi:hypothetical protein
MKSERKKRKEKREREREREKTHLCGFEENEEENILEENEFLTVAVRQSQVHKPRLKTF